MKKLTSLIFILAGLSLLSACGGASSEHGHVTGVVKLNGEPVQYATVTFSPEGGGRSAIAETAADGSYELNYTPGVKGAKIGINQVTISTYVEPELDDDEKVVVPAKPERFPPEYNEKPSETREVVAGENVFDFDIEASKTEYPRSS